MLVVGCGSRTSTLDKDTYGSGPSSGGQGGGGASATAGHGGKSGLDPGASTPTCERYCSGYASKCRSRLNGRDCLDACSEEINGFGGKCQTLGIDALNCLAPFFQDNPLSCEAASNGALASCKMGVDAFTACRSSSAPQPGPTPSPAPNPGPMPIPGPAPNPTPTPPLCDSEGESYPGYCKRRFSCPTGPVITVCTASNAEFFCECHFADGGVAGFTVGPQRDPCLSAGVACGLNLPAN